MMTHLFVYEGDLDEATGTLPLHCTGPDFADPTKLGNYKDVYRLSPSGERSLTSFMQTPYGKWVQLMTARAGSGCANATAHAARSAAYANSSKSRSSTTWSPSDTQCIVRPHAP